LAVVLLLFHLSTGDPTNKYSRK